jgi:hypothetical protein
MDKNSEYSASTQRIGRVVLCVLVAVLSALLIWTSDAPAKTNAPKPTSSANPVTYGKSVQISGSLTGKPNANVPIALQQSPFPFTAFTTVASGVSSPTGAYAFSVVPLINSRYRVATTAATPQVLGKVLEQTVNQRVGFSVGDKTPKKGATVRFYGTVTPARDGDFVMLQRLSKTGAFNLVTQIKLVDSGDARSSYSKRIRVRHNGTYRVIVPATPSLGAGVSAVRTLKVH